MPALPPVPGVISTKLDWVVEGDSMAMTRHFWQYTGGAPSAVDLSSFAAAVVSHMNTSFVSEMSNYTGVASALATDLSSPTGAEVTAGTPAVGTGGTAVLSPGTAMVISHSISRRYRGGHPRTYLPIGVSGNVAVTGLWADAFVASCGDDWGSFVGESVASYGALTITNICSVSYYSGYATTTPPWRGPGFKYPAKVRTTPLVETFTAHTARKVIGSQRRRNRDA